MPAKIKGQISIMIVLSVILILIFVLLYQAAKPFGTQERLQPVVELPAGRIDPGSVRTFMQSCAEQMADITMLVSGITGGTLFVKPEESLIAEALVAVLFKDGNYSSPSVRTNLEQGIKEILPFCTRSTYLNWTGLKASQPSVSASFTKSSTKFVVSYPISITGSQAVTMLGDDYLIEIPVRYQHILDIAIDILEQHRVNPGVLNITLLTSYDLNVSVLQSAKSDYVYIITDPQSTVDRKPFSFIFGVKTA